MPQKPSLLGRIGRVLVLGAGLKVLLFAAIFVVTAAWQKAAAVPAAM